MSTWALLHSSGDQFGGGKVSTLPTAAWHVWLLPAFQSSWSSCTIQERLCTHPNDAQYEPPYLYCSTGHQAQARSSIRFNDWIKTWIPRKNGEFMGSCSINFIFISLVPTKVRWWVESQSPTLQGSLSDKVLPKIHLKIRYSPMAPRA